MIRRGSQSMLSGIRQDPLWWNVKLFYFGPINYRGVCLILIACMFDGCNVRSVCHVCHVCHGCHGCQHCRYICFVVYVDLVVDLVVDGNS